MRFLSHHLNAQTAFLSCQVKRSIFITMSDFDFIMIFDKVSSQQDREKNTRRLFIETFQREDSFGTMTCEQFYGALVRIATDGTSSLKVCHQTRMLFSCPTELIKRVT